MTRRCTHTVRSHADVKSVIWGEGGFRGTRIMTRRWCRGCVGWVPIGPSDDSWDEVKIEIRAAEIAAGGHEIRSGDRTKGPAGRLRSMHWFEGCGWNSACPEPDGLSHAACDNGEPEDGRLHLAGYLAAVIVHHEVD